MTNTNPIQFINPIDLGGNELLNSLLEKLSTAPSSPVAGRSYYNTTDNKAYYYNGTEWKEFGTTTAQVANVVVNADYSTLAGFITNVYDPVNFNEGDLLVLTTATDPTERVWVNLGTNNDDATDFVALSTAYDETEIKALFSAGDGLDYLNGAFSIGTGEVTEAMLATTVQNKLNRNGTTFSLADTGVSGVTYSNGVFTVTHDFGTQAVAVVMRDSANSYRQVPVNNDAPTTNTVRIYFAEQPTNNQYKVTVIPMVF